MEQSQDDSPQADQCHRQGESDRPPVVEVQDGLVAQRTQEWTERASRGSGAPLGSHRGAGSELFASGIDPMVDSTWGVAWEDDRSLPEWQGEIPPIGVLMENGKSSLESKGILKRAWETKKRSKGKHGSTIGKVGSVGNVGKGMKKGGQGKGAVEAPQDQEDWSSDPFSLPRVAPVPEPGKGEAALVSAVAWAPHETLPAMEHYSASREVRNVSPEYLGPKGGQRRARERQGNIGAAR